MLLSVFKYFSSPPVPPSSCPAGIPVITYILLVKVSAATGHRLVLPPPSPGVYIDGGGGGGSVAADGMKPKKIQLEEGKPDSQNQPLVGKNAASYDGKQ